MAMKRSLLGIAAVLAAVAIAAVVALSGPKDPPPPGGPFTLTDGAGKPVSDSDFRGKWMLVYFGYTFCPDVCPTALGSLGSALDMLPASTLDRIQVVFISVDPKRDGGPELTAYARAFHENIIGVTGTPEEIAKTAGAYGARYEVHGDPNGMDYSIDHTSIIYVMDPEGRFKTQFTHNTSPDTIKAKLEAIVK